jgi:hypothetical protein
MLASKAAVCVEDPDEASFTVVTGLIAICICISFI